MLRPPRIRGLPSSCFRAFVATFAVFAISAMMWQPAHQDAAAGSLATIALDMDAGTPGVQTSGTFNQGSQIPIDVVILDADGVGAFEFELIFDSFALELQGWSLGPFLSSTGRTASCEDLVNQHSIQLACGTLGPSPPGPSGDGVLATLTFVHTLTGTTCPQIIDVQTTTVFGDPLPTTYESGCITVVPVDTDNDGVADTSDNCPGVANADQLNGDGRPLGNGPSILGDDATVPNSDAAGDACDSDDDNDGLADIADNNPLGACATFAGWNDGHTAPARGDMTWSDGDSLSLDSDGDSLIDGAECARGTNPRSASVAERLACHQSFGTADTDGDGLQDAWEVCKWGTRPSGTGSTNSDGEGAGDCREAMDVNGNGIVNNTDATFILQAAFGSIAPDWTMDLTGNGVVNTADGTFVQRVVFGVSGCL